MKIKFKKADRNDCFFLREMLYEALFVPAGEKPFAKGIIDLPEIAKYIDRWGIRGDIGLIVQNKDESIGAIWGRLFAEDNKGYGFVDKDTPEIAMAIKSQYRNQGVGKKLLTDFFYMDIEKIR